MLNEFLVNQAGERCYRASVFGRVMLVTDLYTKHQFYCKCVRVPITEERAIKPPTTTTTAAKSTRTPAAKLNAEAIQELTLEEYSGPRRAHTWADSPPTIFP